MPGAERAWRGAYTTCRQTYNWRWTIFSGGFLDLVLHMLTLLCPASFLRCTRAIKGLDVDGSTGVNILHRSEEDT